MTIRQRRAALRRSLRPVAELMESRSLMNGAWGGYAKDAQHTALSTVASQPLQTIRWQAPVDLNPQYSGGEYLLIHYGSPSITTSGTLLLPVKTGASEGFEVQARDASDGSPLWTIATDYVLPNHGWTPSYSPALTTSGALAMPGLGGRIYMVDSPDSAVASITRTLTFYGESNYAADPSGYNASVFISTPITADSAGNIYFGYATQGSAPSGLQSGIARIAADGTATYVTAASASGDPALGHVVQNCAPAISNDGTTLYIAVSSGDRGRGDLLALDSTTLATTSKVALIDPKSGANAGLFDDGTASPVIGPDGDVYYGVLESSLGTNHFRGYLLHFDSTLATTKTPGAFGWDDSPSIVPSSLVPGYEGTSSYLLLAKYNNYAGAGGDGVNRVAILDPNNSVIDPISGLSAMRPVLSIAGPTSDDDHSDHAFAVREWCINTAAVDPFTKSALVNNEDGKLYRWDLTTNTFTEVVVLTAGLGEAYTPTLIGPDGAVFAINNAILFAVGSAAPTVADDAFTVAQDGKLTTPAPGVLANDSGGPGLTLAATIATGPAHGSIGLSPDGSFTYTPTSGYSGPDSFTYTVRDGALTSTPATVSITVTPSTVLPVAVADAFSVNEDGTLTTAAPGVLGNDTGTSLSAILALAPSHGSLTFLADGSFVYTPTPLYDGPDSFSYRVTDGKLSSGNVNVLITVNPVLHAPTTVSESFTVAQDGKLTVLAASGVLKNDTVVDAGVTLTAEVMTGPTHGNLTLALDGSFTYTPTPGYRGPDSFAYRAKNGALLGNTVTDSITVSAVNHAPVGAADNYTGGEDSPIVKAAAIGVLSNDTDQDSNPLTVTLAQDAKSGALTLNADGSFFYIPNPNFNGTDSFTYTASDGTTSTGPISVTLSIASNNDPVIAIGKSISAAQGRISPEFVVATFTDADNEPAANYKATIDWGDGSPTSRGVVTLDSGVYTVTAGHLYDAPGAFIAKVTIDDTVKGGSTVALSSAIVSPIGVGLTGTIVETGNHTSGGALITRVSTPSVAGTAPSGFTVTLFAGPTAIGQATAGDDNTYRIVASALSDGAYDLTLSAVTTVPGSALSFSARVGSIVVDTSPPRIASAVFNLKLGTVSVTFQDAGSGLDPASTLSAGAFSITQRVKGKRTAIGVASISPSSLNSGATSSTITLTLRKKKLPKGVYTVKIGTGVLKDLAGNTVPSADFTAKGAVVHPRGHVSAFARRHA